MRAATAAPVLILRAKWPKSSISMLMAIFGENTAHTNERQQPPYFSAVMTAIIIQLKPRPLNHRAACHNKAVTLFDIVIAIKADSNLPTDCNLHSNFIIQVLKASSGERETRKEMGSQRRG